MIDTNGLSVKEQEAFFKVKHKCELCDVEMPEEALTHYDGYKACSECIEASEKEKQQENEYVSGLNHGRAEAFLEVLTILEGDEHKKVRRLIVEKLNRKQA